MRLPLDLLGDVEVAAGPIGGEPHVDRHLLDAVRGHLDADDVALVDELAALRLVDPEHQCRLVLDHGQVRCVARVRVLDEEISERLVDPELVVLPHGLRGLEPAPDLPETGARWG